MEDFCYGICAFWLLPMGLLLGGVSFLHSVRLGWRQRGLEQGTLYCASCRFNLRGCASWNCPECGAHLDDGRIMTPGHEPPLGLPGRLLLATVAVAGPLVLGCWLLAWGVPVNWEVDRTLALTPRGVDMSLEHLEIEIVGTGERALWGKGRPASMYMDKPVWDWDHRIDDVRIFGYCR